MGNKSPWGQVWENLTLNFRVFKGDFFERLNNSKIIKKIWGCILEIFDRKKKNPALKFVFKNQSVISSVLGKRM